MPRYQANLILLAIAAIWGLAFVYQKTAMDHIGPFLFLAARSLIAAVALFPLAMRENAALGSKVPAEFWIISVAGGCSFFIGGILQQIGLVTATVTNTGFLTGLYVVITPLLMWIVLRRLPRAYVWPSVGLAFVGTWLLGGGTIGGFSQGDWLVAFSAIFWSAHMLIVENSAQHARPIGFTAVQFAAVAAFSAIGVMLFESVSLAGLSAAIFEIAYVGLLSSALTFTLLAYAMKYTPAVEATILVSMETVFAALCAVILLGEWLAPIGWLGAALMFAASLIVQAAPAFADRRRRRERRQRRTS
ncbi:MAG: DMT family transporter [Hyphomicrobiaceae bacterium]